MHDLDRMLQLQLNGQSEEARAISDKLEALGPDKILDPMGNNTTDIWMRHCFNRGWFLLQEGKYQEGCQLLENGRFLNVYGNPPLNTKAQLFNPNEHDLKDKVIVLSMEGGYGDEIIHARFATEYKKLGAREVYIASSPDLLSLFKRIEGVDGVVTRDRVDTLNPDYWVPGFSAGWVAGLEFDTLPNKAYLTALPESVATWSNFIQNNDKPRVGIRWAGNPKFEHQQFRRFPIDFMTNLRQYADQVDFYSFQRDHNTIEVPEGIVDLQHALISWEDTAAAIMNLDLVITSCTSIAHLAGALGKETWVIVPALPYHTWTHDAPTSTTTPYYETVRLFRQKSYGTWNDVFQSMYQAFEERFRIEHKDLPNADKQSKQLNLGCGISQYEGYVNVDVSPHVNPDQVVDLNVLPWPWKDNEFDHIVAKDILEHLGDTPEHFLDIMKEMYRVSDNGAVWEIQVPHWRCDTAVDDPTHKRVLTHKFFQMFDQRVLMDEGIRNKKSDSMIAFEKEMDVSFVDSQFEYVPEIIQRVRDGKIDQEELNFLLNHSNNIALSMVVMMQVHKPARYNPQEFIDALKEATKEKIVLKKQ